MFRRNAKIMAAFIFQVVHYIRHMQRARHYWKILACVVIVLCAVATASADTLSWNTNKDQVTADIQSVPLLHLLEAVAQVTGWHVYVESNTTFTASSKFRDLPAGEALRHLLGNLNFALVPQTNSNPRLYVFHSSQANATLRVRPADLNAASPKGTNIISNELIVRLKPGVRPESLACLQTAKIVGHIDSLNAYQVRFEDAEAAAAARTCLSGEPNVLSVESNFSIDAPNPIQRLNSNIANNLDLKIKPQTGDCDVVVALVDTSVASLGKNLDAFLLPRVSVISDGNSPPPTGNSTDPNHGTAMAETILTSINAATSGKTSVKILSVDVYGNNPSTTTFDVAAGISRAINSSANVINLSLGGSGDSPLLHDMIRSASDQGIVFFGAAGNEPVTTPTYPAAYPEVIAVTARDRNGQIADYANRGDFIDIMAPGTSVVPFDGQSFLVTGTSAATAFASGIAAGLADASHNCPIKVVPTIREKLAFKPAATQ